MSTRPADRNAAGFRVTPGQGPRIRSDVIDVYIVKRAPRSADWLILQLLRAKDPLCGTWHPIMGHIEAGETAVAAAQREMHEEVGLDVRNRAVLGFWALEQVHPFYIAAIDAVVMSPRFVVQVRPSWTPTLNHEHAKARWAKASRASSMFMWPGQLAAVRELTALLKPNSLSAGRLKINLD